MSNKDDVIKTLLLGMSDKLNFLEQMEVNHEAKIKTFQNDMEVNLPSIIIKFYLKFR